jgi:hypothetical protein
VLTGMSCREREALIENSKKAEGLAGV